MTEQQDTNALFPRDLPAGEWSTFNAAGFERPVTGYLHNTANPPTCGVALGGIDTGCLDLQASGTFGFCTAFNSHVPRRGPLNVPFLAMHLGNRSWLLTTEAFELVNSPVYLPNIIPYYLIHTAQHIDYWGHYPVADVQYTLDAPVSVALRAWSPFIPGDLQASNIPAAVFEVHLRNESAEAQAGRLTFSFPGPTEAEAGGYPLQRRELHEPRLSGICVEGRLAGYVLAVMEDTRVDTGGDLGVDMGNWKRAHRYLPHVTGGPGAAVQMRFSLQPGEERTVRWVLAWHSPQWYSGGSPEPLGMYSAVWYDKFRKEDEEQDSRSHSFTHMYAQRYPDALSVAREMVVRHEELLRRILAWQQAIYDAEDLPLWLRDSLVNNLYQITETGFWAQARPPIGDWCKPEDGLWAMSEDPRHCPQIECTPCTFYGNYPLVLFFPQLALSNLRGYKAYQFPNGEVTFDWGGKSDGADWSTPCDLAAPSAGYQTTLNGPCVVDLVFRYWRCTGDDAALRELYDLVKRSTIFTMNLRAEDGADGIISFPTGNVGLEWFEACTWAGMASHVGGIHLANLREMEAMARAVGDGEFAEQCAEWFRGGSASMEDKLWNGSYYINYWDQKTGDRSDLVMANQLDGEWMTWLAGTPGVFRPERIRQALDAIAKACVAPTPYGAVNFATPEGRPTTSGEGHPGWNYNPYAFFPPEVIMLGMTYIYAGQREFGLELCRRCWTNLQDQGRAWDWPNIVRGDNGEVVYGGDYYQNMLLWSLPAALAGGPLEDLCKEGGLVRRVIQAGRPA